MGCSASAPALDTSLLVATPELVSVAALQGRWHVALTTLPMWHKGDKFRPTLNYGPHPDPGDDRMSDRVEYGTSVDDPSKIDVISGFNTRDPNCCAHLTWRGASGIIKYVTSDWYFVHVDHTAGIAAIVFTKTAFTPDGIDIIVRDPATARAEPQRIALEECKRKLSRIERFAALVPQLKPPCGVA